MRRKIEKWLNSRNEMFSSLAGEDFTNLDVIVAHAWLLLFLAVLGIAGSIDCMPGGGI